MNELIKDLNKLLSMFNNNVTEQSIHSYVSKVKSDINTDGNYSIDKKDKIEKTLDNLYNVKDYNVGRKYILDLINIINQDKN